MAEVNTRQANFTVNKIWVKHVSIINTPQTHLLDMSLCFK